MIFYINGIAYYNLKINEFTLQKDQIIILKSNTKENEKYFSADWLKIPKGVYIISNILYSLNGVHDSKMIIILSSINKESFNIYNLPETIINEYL